MKILKEQMIQYKNYTIDYLPEFNYGPYSIQVDGEDYLFETEDTAKAFIDSLDEPLTEEIKNKQLDEIEKFIEDIYALRKDSIAKDGEYSLGNLLFKELRNKGYLDNLKELKNKIIGKELSLECLQEANEIPDKDIIKADLINIFGILNSPLDSDASYILDDGTILNTKSEADINSQHENIAKYIQNKYHVNDLDENNGSKFVANQLNAIRVTPWLNGIYIPEYKITPAQEAVLLKYIEDSAAANKKEFMVATMNGDQQMDFVVDALATPLDCIELIKLYYKDGLLGLNTAEDWYINKWESLESTIDQDLADNRQPVEIEQAELETPFDYKAEQAEAKGLKDDKLAEGIDYKGYDINHIKKAGFNLVTISGHNYEGDEIITGDNNTYASSQIARNTIDRFLSKNPKAINERLEEKQRYDYRNELSQIAFNQAIVSDNGLFHIYNVKESDVNRIINQIRNLDYIDWVQKAVGRYDFSKVGIPGSLQPRIYEIYGQIKEN